MSEVKSTIQLLPEDRPWEYDCDGIKTHKGDYTKLWTEEDEANWLKENLDKS